jgi:hypothetical protein
MSLCFARPPAIVRTNDGWLSVGRFPAAPPPPTEEPTRPPLSCCSKTTVLARTGACLCSLGLMFVNHSLDCHPRSVITQTDTRWLLQAGLAPEDYWLERQAERLPSIHCRQCADPSLVRHLSPYSAQHPCAPQCPHSALSLSIQCFGREGGTLRTCPPSSLSCTLCGVLRSIPARFVPPCCILQLAQHRQDEPRVLAEQAYATRISVPQQ